MIYAITAHGETLLARDMRREQSAQDAGWVFNSADDGICLVAASGRSRSGTPVVLGAGWNADDGFILSVVTLPFLKLDAPSIDVVGTTRSYAFPKTRSAKMTGHDAMELKQDIAAGRALRVSGKTREGDEVFDFPVGSSAMAIAALDACAEMFKARPVPSTRESGNAHGVYAQNPESGCSITGHWPEASKFSGFWIAIDVTRDGASIQLRRLAVKPGTGMSGVLDLRDLGGDVMNFTEESEGTVVSDEVAALAKRIVGADIPISLEPVASLEKTLLEGETKSFRVKFRGKKAQVLQFGGPVARAPAAMFSVCRSMLFATPSAP
jgi:hypothetical protein